MTIPNPDHTLRTRALELVNQTIEELWNLLTQQPIHITDERLFPYGLRFTNARAVCFIVEEITTQNLRYHAESLGIRYEAPEGALGVMDCILHFEELSLPIHLNIKASFTSSSGASNDVSKAPRLIQFYGANPDALLVISTIKIEMQNTQLIYDRNISLNVAWLPRVYYNRANHNLQSNLNGTNEIYRTNQEFIRQLSERVDAAGHGDTY